MKTKSFIRHGRKSIISAIMVAGFINFNYMQAQTYGRGALTNDGSCTATGTGGGCSNTFIGSSAAGANNNTGTYNTFIGASSGNGNTSGASNTAIGGQTLQSNTTGSNNNAFGYTALFTNTGSDNCAFGHTGLYFNSSGSKNLALGNFCMYSNTTGSENTVGGYKAGYYTQTGVNNTLFGTQAGHGVVNNSFSYNCMFGYQSGYSNTTGGSNAFFGYKAGYTSTASYNSLFGAFAGYNTSTGAWNTFLGYGSAYNNTTGDTNVVIGLNAMYYNQTGSYNTVVGINAGQGAVNQSSSNNSFFGYKAGYSNTTGNNITCVGYGADVNGQYSNASSFGNGAITTGSNTIRVGNANVTAIGGAVAWNSDGRFKFNVQENVKGLEFIKKLRPVTYQIDTKKLEEFFVKDIPDSIKAFHMNAVGDCAPATAIIRSGFIAQEVEQAEKEANFSSSIVYKPQNGNDAYALAYAEIVVPLVKAVQELSQKVDSLSEIASVQQAIINNSGIGNADQQLQKKINEDGTRIFEKKEADVKLSLPESPTIGDVYPNPNDGNAKISYFVPVNMTGAKVIFTDMLGRVLEEKQLLPGYGQLNLDTHGLPNGTYTCSLQVDGKVLDSKTIIKQ